MSWAETLDRVTGNQRALELRIAALERVEVTSVPIVNVLSRGALTDGSDTRAVIQAAIDDALVADGPVTILIPSGGYDITSLVGTGRNTSSLLISGGTVNIVGVPGSQLRFGNGSAIRPFIVRDAATVEIYGLDILYTRTDGVAAVGLSLENSSKVRVENNRFEDWTFYAIGISEDTSAPSVSASTISFDAASHQIRDTSPDFLEFTTAHPVTVVGSLSNNGKYTPTAVAADGKSITVAEDLTNEVAGASSVAVQGTTFTFNAADRTIASPTVNLSRFPENSEVVVTGSALNNNTYTVVDLDPSGQVISVAEPLVDEAAGATVTLTKVGKPTVAMQVATSCDRIRILRNDFRHIGLYGVETFPKVESHDLLVAYNTFYDCGYITGTGAAIKAGQLYTSGLVALNQIAHCVFGIIAGQWEALHITTNTILNCYAFGIAISAGNHPKAQARHQSLLVESNHINYVADYMTGVLFDPTAANSIDPARRRFNRSYGAININGVLDALLGPAWTNGPIVIARNEIGKWGSGLSFYKSLMPIPNVHYIDNHLTDTGPSLVTPVTATGVVTAGSAVISTVVTDGVAGVAGWAENIPIISDPQYFAAGTVIESLDPLAQTITASTVALHGAATSIGFRSAFPLGLRTRGNTFVDTRVSYGSVTAGSPVISSVVDGTVAGLDGWEIGDSLFTDTAYFVAGTTVIDVDEDAHTLTASHNALAGAPTTIALRKDLASLIQWYSESGFHDNNQIDGYGPYALQIKGDQTILLDTKFRHINQLNTAGRSPVLFNERGTYTALRTVLDVGNTPTTGYAADMYIGVISPGATGLGGSVTLASVGATGTLSSIPAVSGITIATALPAKYDAGLRTVYGTAAPTTGAWAAGEKMINLTPTVFIAIDHWYCAASGTPGTWRALGLGQGTTAQLPGTLVSGDAGYIFECTDTGIFKYWDGSAWDDLTGPAAPAAIAAVPFITQTPSSLLSAEQALSALATGYMKSATTTGVVSTQAVPIPVTDGGTGTTTQFTQGSVIFAGASGVYTEDNANYFWDDSTNRLGIGTAAPAAPLDINVLDAGTTTAVDGFITRHRSTGAPGTNFGGVWRMQAETSNNTNANQFNVTGLWATATNGSQKAQVKFFVYDTSAREAIRLEASGTAAMIGVLGAAASARINVTGSRGGNAALASLLTALATFGWITDSTTA